MKSKLLLLVFLILCNVYIVYAQQEFIYTIQYAKSFRRDLLDKYMGCQQNSTIIYGTYLYPSGAKDALFVYLNQGTYQTRLACRNDQNKFVKLFGTEQDYDELLKADPSIAAESVKYTVRSINPHYIVSWKYPLSKHTQKSIKWLQNFAQKLNTQSGKVYLKLPASYFCHQSNGKKYLQDIKVNKFIVEMYGQQAGLYTSYESMFEKDTVTSQSTEQNYSKECPKYPSLKTLTENFPQRQFFIEKTLQKQEAGFIGPRFQQYLKEAKSIYGKAAFLDSFSEQIIQL